MALRPNASSVVDTNTCPGFSEKFANV